MQRILAVGICVVDVTASLYQAPHHQRSNRRLFFRTVTVVWARGTGHNCRVAKSRSVIDRRSVRVEKLQEPAPRTLLSGNPDVVATVAGFVHGGAILATQFLFEGHARRSVASVASVASASSSSLSRVVDVDRAFVALRRRAVRRLELVRELLQSGVPEAAHGKSGVALLLHDALQVRDGVRRPPVLWSICAAAGEEIEPVGLRNHFEVEYKKKSEGTVLIYGWATGMN